MSRQEPFGEEETLRQATLSRLAVMCAAQELQAARGSFQFLKKPTELKDVIQGITEGKVYYIMRLNEITIQFEAKAIALTVSNDCTVNATPAKLGEQYDPYHGLFVVKSKGDFLIIKDNPAKAQESQDSREEKIHVDTVLNT